MSETIDIAERAEGLIDELWEVGIRPTSLESRFGWLLVMALREWVPFGRFADRSLEDLLLHECAKPDKSGFVTFVQQHALVDGWPNDMGAHRRDLMTHALIIQAAIDTDPPERVIALFAEEAEFRARHQDDEDPDDPAEPLRWADEWRRMFATSGWCPSEVPDPNGRNDRDITMDRCRACGKLRGSIEHEYELDGKRWKCSVVPDPCLGMLPGVVGACCGHGRPGRACLDNLSGPAAAERMRELGGNPPAAAFLPDPEQLDLDGNEQE